MKTVDKLVELLEKNEPEILNPEQRARARSILLLLKELVREAVQDVMAEKEGSET